MGRPGIMFYFDMLEPLRVLTDADRGRLLMAMLEYGQSGTVPEFEGMLALAWEFVKPKLDRDEDNYENAQNQRAYAAFCKKRYRAKLPKISFEEWLEMDNETQRAITGDNETQRAITGDNETQRAITGDASRYPTTTTPATTPTPTPTPTPAPAAAAAITTADGESRAAADRETEEIASKGVVILTDAQTEDLQKKLGAEMFSCYVDKLSEFIVRNDARVKNHYETILKWWQEDGAVRRRSKQTVPKGASGRLGQAELDAIQRVLRE